MNTDFPYLPLKGGGRPPKRSEGGRVGVHFTPSQRPPPGSLRSPTSPFQGEVKEKHVPA